MEKVSRKFRQSAAYIGLPLIPVALIASRIGRNEEFILLINMLLAVFGYVASVQDLKTKKIPNKLIIAMLAAWVTASMPLLFFETSQAVDLLIDSALGFVLGGGLFLLVYLISRKGVGGGDVKFIAAVGLYLGTNSIVPAILYGSILAAITGGILFLLKKINRKDTIPLAPFLYIGILITMFLG